MRESFLIFAAVLLASIVIAAEPIRVTATPMITFAPRGVAIKVRLLPSTYDRELWILVCDEMIADMCTKDTATTSHFVQLDGEQSRKLHTLDVRTLAEGSYRVVVTAGPYDRVRAYADVHVERIGMGQ